MQKCGHLGKDPGIAPGSEKATPIKEQVMFRYDDILGILRESGYDRVLGFERRSELWIQNEDSRSYLSADTVYRTLVNMNGLDNLLTYLRSPSR